MPKHKEDKIWTLRKEGESNGYVKTLDTKYLDVYYYGDMSDPESVINFKINRNDARVLANRILKCLDDTK